jgi:uncharacterized membrane protein
VDVKSISLAAVFASLYAVLLVFLAPMSFGPVQLRVADCLLPLAALFGWPVIWGATVGCLVGNAAGGIMAFGAIEPMDVVFGSSANFLATLAIFVLRRRRLLGCICGSVIIGLVVGGYLWIIIPPPDILGLVLQPWAAMIISITISSMVAVAVIGYILLSALSQPNIIEPMKSRGLRVYD